VTALSTKWRAPVEAARFLNAEQARQVNDALAEARAKTSVRIVPVFATSSVRFSRAEELLGFWAAALGLALVWLFLAYAPIGREWTPNPKVSRFALLPIGLVMVLGFGLGVLLGTRVHWLRRLFLSRERIAQAVQDRAKQVLQSFALHEKSQGADPAAALAVVYVSLSERAVAVAADERVRRELPPQRLDAAAEGIARALPDSDAAEALCKGIADLADALAGAFPAERAPAAPPPRLQIVD